MLAQGKVMNEGDTIKGTIQHKRGKWGLYVNGSPCVVGYDTREHLIETLLVAYAAADIILAGDSATWTAIL